MALNTRHTVTITGACSGLNVLVAQRIMSRAVAPATPATSPPRSSNQARAKKNRLTRKTKPKNSAVRSATWGKPRKYHAKPSATTGSTTAVRFSSGEERSQRRAASVAPRNRAQKPRHTVMAVTVFSGVKNKPAQKIIVSTVPAAPSGTR